MAADLVKLFKLSGRTAVITGAAGVICGTLAENLAENGVKIVLLDINAEKVEERAAAIRSSGGEVLAYQCNVIDQIRLKEVYADIVEKWGVPDFLINGAGGNKPSGSTMQNYLTCEYLEKENSGTFFDIESENFQSVVNLNFYGTLYPTQIFSKGMVKKNFGSIVNISSMSGITPLTKVVAYSAAKAAVINFTRWLAVYLAHTGIRVNTIAPGFISTEQSRFLQFDKKTGSLNARGREIIEKTPMGRFGKPEELIGTLVWLLSEASHFVTGIVVPVDGGFSSFSI